MLRAGRLLGIMVEKGRETELLKQMKPGWDVAIAENEKILSEIRGLPDDTEELDLSDRFLTSLAGVKLPSGLRRLYLSGTLLTSLAGVVLPQGLKRLYLNFTDLTSLEGVVLPHGLKTLELRNTKLTNLEGIKLPQGLQELDLSNSMLSSLEGVVMPQTLRELDLSNTMLSSLEGVALPLRLRELDLSYTAFSSLDGVVLPSELRTLTLDVSLLEDLPEGVLPSGLRELYIDGSDLTSLPESIRNLKKLETLELSELFLTELPDWLPELGLPFIREEFCRAICLSDTIVKGVDMSIFDRSQEEILQWFKERKQARLAAEAGLVVEEDQPLNELKVVFLGDGEAGKTHTIARLLNDGKQVRKFRGVSTPGIVIEDKTYTIGDRDVKVHFWDFGGQEILHSMHRMFLTQNTLYVVVLNVREGNQEDRARYWLHNLKSFAGGAPVLLVLNKMDMNKNASVNESDLQKLYPGLTEIVKLSTLTYSDTQFREKFIDVLLEQIGKMEILEQPLIAAGRRVKEKIQAMKESYIHGDMFRRFCNECGVTGSDNVLRGLLETFGQLGVSFCYSGSMELEQHVVLKPDWITNAIYIILFNKVHAVTNGLVSHNTIYEMLSSVDTETIRRAVADATYTRKEVDYVLEVFRKFRLSFLVEEGMEFLPMLCDAKTTAEAAKYEDDPDALEFRMHYEYLPPNVIHRLMVERRKELDRGNVWLTGARFVCGDTKRNAVVKSEGNLIRILVRAEKEPRDPQRYLDELKDALERINLEMGLTVSKMEVVYKEDGKTACFDYDDLLFAQEKGYKQLLCRELRKEVLLRDVLMQTDFPEDEKQKKLREDIRQACEMLQNRKKYWDSSEDERTDYLMDMLTAKGYLVRDQHRGGFSESGIQSGELDLDIRLTSVDKWSALEALNLKGSSKTQIKYWNAHLKKLLDNYNEVGRAFLFHVSYVQCKKDNFSKVCNDLYEHLRFYSPPGFELMRRFVQLVPLTDDPFRQDTFMRAVKCVYDCGGIPMTVYHFFVRIGK